MAEDLDHYVSNHFRRQPTTSKGLLVPTVPFRPQSRVSLFANTGHLVLQTFQHFIYSHEYAKVYSEESDFLSHQDCSEVTDEVFELAFGSSKVIISDILIQNINSYMETELIVLNGGLHSGRKNPLHCIYSKWNVLSIFFPTFNVQAPGSQGRSMLRKEVLEIKMNSLNLPFLQELQCICTPSGSSTISSTSFPIA